MKTLILSAAVAALGFSTVADEASADHRDSRDRRDLRDRRGSRKGFDLRIGGGKIGIAISTGRRGTRVGISRRPGFRPGPPVVRPRRHYHVKYFMHDTRTIHTHSHRAAHRYERMLERLGFHAKIRHGGGHYDVVYNVHGIRSRTFRSHRAAHAFARLVERRGAHARVVHHD